ncbi:MAG: isochorismate synthase [Frankiales bacterium]|nr:isochorismate synthase [Frankiales bacterium]
MLTAPSVDLLRVSTVRIPEPGALLSLVPRSGALAWIQEGEGIVGWGEAARLEVTGPGRFAEAKSWWDTQVAATSVSDEVRLPGTGLVAFGSFAFDADTTTSVLIVPEVVVGHRDGTWWLTTVGVPMPPLGGGSEPTAPTDPRFTDGAVDSAAWGSIVAEAVRRIEGGEVGKVVLAREVEARNGEPWDIRWPLTRLADRYAGCWTFAVDGLIGATPEMLVRLRDGVATSRVLAGTLRRSGDANQDLLRSDDLSRSIKDVEEHGYGVRSVVESLSLHCTAIDVPASPFVLALPNLMHLASDVTGTVSDGATSLELVASLHPSAAVCGTPTSVAFDLITEIEGLSRGRYAGPVGWLDASGDGEWGIALRCGQVDPADPSLIRLYAGCGIVAGSEPERELAESNAKLLPMRDALTA